MRYNIFNHITLVGIRKYCFLASVDADGERMSEGVAAYLQK